MIYVDPMMDCMPNANWRYFQACHMFTDSDDLTELHEFAKRIGLRREWFQAHYRLPHYDLTAARRVKAIELGAVSCGREKTVEEMKRRRACCPGHELRRLQAEFEAAEREAKRLGYPKPKPAAPAGLFDLGG